MARKGCRSSRSYLWSAEACPRFSKRSVLGPTAALTFWALRCVWGRLWCGRAGVLRQAGGTRAQYKRNETRFLESGNDRASVVPEPHPKGPRCCSLAIRNSPRRSEPGAMSRPPTGESRQAALPVSCRAKRSPSRKTKPANAN